MKKFLKKSDLKLVNGGYLSNKDGDPVTNLDFVSLQKRAHYIVTFAKHAKGKDFKGKAADSIMDVRKAVSEELAGTKKQYVAKPEKKTLKLKNQLHDEAMAFMKFEEESTKIDKMNNFLQSFNVLAEFEEFGLFFEDGIEKLNKIYTMDDIVKAVEATIDILD